MSTTSIEWATHVWNPFTGCDRVSPGCANCYAATTAESNQRKERGRIAKAEREGKPRPKVRYQNDGDPKSSGPGFGFTVHWDRLENPDRWPAGARVFVNSMSDVFHEEAPTAAIQRLWRVMRDQPAVNFLILTKRPERMLAWVSANNEVTVPTLPNVWLGVSIENRRFVHRADLLRETPAAVRFISAEPLLGPLVPGTRPARDLLDQGDPVVVNGLDLTNIDWLIAGGESGKDRRRFDLQWVRDLRDDCLTLSKPCELVGGDGRCCPPGRCDFRRSIAFFFKQGSAHRPGQHRELDGRTWDELPERPDGLAVRTEREVVAA